MSEYERCAGLLMDLQTPRSEWWGLFRQARDALVETMKAPNDPRLFEPIKVLGHTLLVATQVATRPMYRRHELLVRPGGPYLQFGVFLGSEIDLGGPDVCRPFADAAEYIRTHGLATTHPHILGYTHRTHAEAASQAGFASSPVQPGALGDSFALALQREHAVLTPEGRAGAPMGHVYIAEQRTDAFEARYPQAGY